MTQRTLWRITSQDTGDVAYVDPADGEWITEEGLDDSEWTINPWEDPKDQIPEQGRITMSLRQYADVPPECLHGDPLVEHDGEVYELVRVCLDELEQWLWEKGLEIAEAPDWLRGRWPPLSITKHKDSPHGTTDLEAG